jgi:hypothetical protein
MALLMAGVTDGPHLDGDAGVLATIVGLTDAPNPDFAVVEP